MKFINFSKRFKLIYTILNVSFLIIGFLLYILSLSENNKSNSLIYISFIIIAVVLIGNFIIQVFESLFRIKVEKSITNLMASNKYTDVEKYISKISKYNRFKNINQVMIYYMAYIELLRNNLDKAILYLEQFDENNQSLVNSIYLVYIIFLKYMLYSYMGKNDQVKDTYEIYLCKKEYLLRIKRLKNDEVYLLFSIMDDLQRFDFANAKQKISGSKLIIIPFIKDFINS